MTDETKKRPDYAEDALRRLLDALYLEDVFIRSSSSEGVKAVEEAIKNAQDVLFMREHRRNEKTRRSDVKKATDGHSTVRDRPDNN